MKEIGNFLKNAREKQGLQLSDVANSTKIHISKLKAIEEGDSAALPAKVFLVGLIKSYARELKIDSETINKLCADAYKTEETEVVTRQETPPTQEEPEPDTHNLGLFQVPRTLVIGLSITVSLLLAALIFVVVDKMNSYSEETKVPESVFNKTIQHEEALSESDSKTESKGEVISQDKTEKQNLEIKTSAQENKTKASAVVTDTKIEKTSEDSTAVKESSNVVPTPQPSATPESDQAAIVRSDNKLILTALEPVRVEIVWEDGFVQVMLLKSQETKTLVFSTPIKLRIDNGGAVNVQFNQEEPKVPGAFNQPVELEFK